MALGLSACASVQTPAGNVSYMVFPWVADMDTRVHDRAGTGSYDPRWSFDMDSHPAVRPAAASRQAVAESPDAGSGTRHDGDARANGQLLGGALGALAGAQAGNRIAGIVAGSAFGTLAGGRLADPCAPGLNAGTVWGTLAGGLFGSLFGWGRGREFWTAVGAAGGAIRGSEMGADGRACR